MKKFTFGLKKSKPEPIDNVVSFNYEKVDMPSQFSLKDRVKQVYDQLSLNACSANAAANFLSLSDKSNVLKCDISRLFLYFCTRWLDNNKMLPVEDNGATLKSVFTAINTYHYIDEVKYPYEIEKVDSIPPSEVFIEALTVNKIVCYRQMMPCRASLKYILYKMQQPILCGIMVYSNFIRLTKEDDILKLPSPSDELLGGHAVCIIAFDDETDTFEILNSHGSKFANDGYFRIKSEYLLNKEMAFEFYTVNTGC